MRVRKARIGPNWHDLWPCAVLKPGDAIEAKFADNGDLVDLRLPDRLRIVAWTWGEIEAALDTYEIKCSRCNVPTLDKPLRFTFQGAAEFYCVGCGLFYQVLDYLEES